MRSKLLLSGLLIGAGISGASAAINVNLPEQGEITSISYYYVPIKQYVEAKTRAERGMVSDSVAVVDSKAVIEIPATADSYMFGLNINNNNVQVFAVPQDNVDINVTSVQPFAYTMGGSEIAAGINELNMQVDPLMAKVNELRASGNSTPEAMQALGDEYVSIQKNFINSNPDGAAAGVALLNLEGEEFVTVFEAMPASFRNSIIYPLAEKQYEAEKQGVEMEKKQKALQSGDVEAPNFTLKNLEGKDVSLSDFKGKWVILDFWGTWCPWCIKGFPELKEAYQKYAGELEIIGIDCRDTEDEWRAGVKKYELPWVNVYNPASSSVLADYAVQGFPTKAIIGPDGKIKNITVGHRPEFFTVLAELLAK